jgi:hypothetical protein
MCALAETGFMYSLTMPLAACCRLSPCCRLVAYRQSCRMPPLASICALGCHAEIPAHFLKRGCLHKPLTVLRMLPVLLPCRPQRVFAHPVCHAEICAHLFRLSKEYLRIFAKQAAGVAYLSAPENPFYGLRTFCNWSARFAQVWSNLGYV